MRTCMGRPFREAIASTPVVLEIVPPGRRVSEKSVNAFVERVRDSVRSLENLNGVNIPEVLEENHAGQPFYRDLDPRDFAALLGDLGVDPIVNKVVAHVPSEPVLRRWIRESVEDHGFRNFVLVGGNSSRVRYPGPTVVEANRILRTLTKGRDDIALGNITIAERDHEVDRLVEKTRAGCDFFTTQVLFEAEPIATARSARGEYRGGLGPQLRSGGADGPRVPLVARKRCHGRSDLRHRIGAGEHGRDAWLTIAELSRQSFAT